MSFNDICGIHSDSWLVYISSFYQEFRQCAIYCLYVPLFQAL